jgi:tripartite-type tricarboxylate transporter receptor subunit TctC
MSRTLTRVASALIFAFVMAFGAPGIATAQDYPSRPIHIIVGYPPGAGVDFTARLFANWLQNALGQPTIVENRSGAAGEIAAEYVSRSDPDGYTLMYAVGSDLEWTKFLTKRPTIDPLKDLTPIATVISSVNCVAVNAASPFKTFKDLVAFARQNPGKLTYGTSGTQSYYYLIGQILKQQGVDMLHVPYKGNAPVLSAILGREVDVALTTLGSIEPNVASGKLRILAVMEPNRFAGAPDIPTIAETLPQFRAPLSWFGLFGPPGLPQPIVQKLNVEISKALRSPEIDSKIKNLDLNVFPTDPGTVRPLIVESTATFQHLIESMHIAPAD